MFWTIIAWIGMKALEVIPKGVVSWIMTRRSERKAQARFVESEQARRRDARLMALKQEFPDNTEYVFHPEREDLLFRSPARASGSSKVVGAGASTYASPPPPPVYDRQHQNP